MTTEILLFSISAGVMLLLVLFRSLELAFKKDFISRNFRNKTDIFILNIWNKFITFIVKIKDFVASKLKKVSGEVLHFFVLIWEALVKKSEKYIDMIRGKGVVNNKGSVSFFLSSISKDHVENKHKSEISHMREIKK